MAQVRQRVQTLLSVAPVPAHRFWRYSPDGHALLHCAHRMSLVEVGAEPMYWPAAHFDAVQAVHIVAVDAPYAPLNVEAGHATGG